MHAQRYVDVAALLEEHAAHFREGDLTATRETLYRMIDDLFVEALWQYCRNTMTAIELYELIRRESDPGFPDARINDPRINALVPLFE